MKKYNHNNKLTFVIDEDAGIEQQISKLIEEIVKQKYKNRKF